jgi:hypothetical protein
MQADQSPAFFKSLLSAADHAATDRVHTAAGGTVAGEDDVGRDQVAAGPPVDHADDRRSGGITTVLPHPVRLADDRRLQWL